MQITEEEKINAWNIVSSYCMQRRDERNALQLDTCSPELCILKRIDKECFCFGPNEAPVYIARRITDHEVCQAIKTITSDCKISLDKYGHWEKCKCMLKDINENICPLRPGNLFLSFLKTLSDNKMKPETLLHKIFRSCRKDHAICDTAKKK